jgi:segregation and condensation protein A
LNYEIKLDQFQGPFDLLLFFIERDELDIYDIPIAKLTEDFLHYLKQMQQMNIELAGEFILVAASLMRIKVKMLLPRKELDAAGNEIDPRQSLVERLIEYKKYKATIETLRILEDERQAKMSRGNLKQEYQNLLLENPALDGLANVNLFQLLKTFQKVVVRFKEKQARPTHVVLNYPFSIAQKKEFLEEMIVNRGEVEFSEILLGCSSKIEAIFTFLALLDLLQMQVLEIFGLNEEFNSFTLKIKNRILHEQYS